MKKKAQTDSVIAVAIFVILGVIVISIASITTNNLTATTFVRNDTFVVSNTTCTDITSSSGKCILSLQSITNASSGDYLSKGNFTTCNNRGAYATGLIGKTGANGLYSGWSLNATYTEVSCSYVGNSFVQTTIPYIIILLAVLVFIGVAKWTSEQH